MKNIKLLTFLVMRWYYSFGVNSISYGSGDTFGVILKSLIIVKNLNSL